MRNWIERQTTALACSGIAQSLRGIAMRDFVEHNRNHEARDQDQGELDRIGHKFQIGSKRTTRQPVID